MAERNGSNFRIVRHRDEQEGFIEFLARQKTEEGGDQIGEPVKISLDGLFGNGTAKVLTKQTNGTLAVRAMLEGLNAIADSTLNSVKDPHEALQKISERFGLIAEGTWSQRGGGGSGMNDVVRAVARVKGISEQDALAKVRSLSDQQYGALEKAASIQAEVKAIKAERARAKAGEGDNDALANI